MDPAPDLALRARETALCLFSAGDFYLENKGYLFFQLQDLFAKIVFI